MPEAPVKTPTKTEPHAPPEEQPQRRLQPDKICEPQKQEIVRRIAPLLP